MTAQPPPINSNPTLNLLGLDQAALLQLMTLWQEKPFRARQLKRWIHQLGQADFALMSDLAQGFRAQLALKCQIVTPPIISEHTASDATVKWLFDMGKGDAIETVFIPETRRGTLCISSQAGCAVNCRFCSTGKQGFSRNLTTAEIVAQLWHAQHQLPAVGTRRAITNVVMMGMGEPLLNYDAVLPALQLMIDDEAYGLSRRKVTVSTSGVVPMMARLARDCPVALAVSLHAPNDGLRDQLVPLNKKYPLAQLLKACIDYLPFAPRDYLTFEYCMLDGVNDSVAQARELVKLVRTVPCKFNLIPFNPYPESGLRASKATQIELFARVLQDAGLITTVRKTRGEQINAACGQLVGDVQNRLTRPLVQPIKPFRLPASAPSATAVPSIQ